MKDQDAIQNVMFLFTIKFRFIYLCLEKNHELVNLLDIPRRLGWLFRLQIIKSFYNVIGESNDLTFKNLKTFDMPSN